MPLGLSQIECELVSIEFEETTNDFNLHMNYIIHHYLDQFDGRGWVLRGTAAPAAQRGRVWLVAVCRRGRGRGLIEISGPGSFAASNDCEYSDEF